ncbi:Lsm14 N-terminal [Dimargaris cristalligena]|uniref:Lsm14 N-terminal n=1 Tax=Dimargaris cristalligena TaxID=215637 RepID=A0A4P9ZT88_9FUNG|nr:Lsm14 N-terminal [Dimargaris cristalligena]|eukprot:RKP36723.1 Lsm14 N-terminal [Dimargaris cristalligena]
MKADSLYGSRISLISKSNIRYLGILHEINEQDSTVALEQVRSMGTEGRKGGDPDEEIPASDEVFEFIQFRATDVIDIRLEEPEEAPKPAPPPPSIPNDPAILGVSVIYV